MKSNTLLWRPPFGLRMDLVKSPYDRVGSRGMLRIVSGPNAQHRAQSGGCGGIQFTAYIGQEQYRRRIHLQRVYYAPIALGVLLCTDVGVEVSVDILREVARICVREEQLLRKNAAGGIDADPLTLLVPPSYCGRYICKDLTSQLARAIALVPDLALKRFERGGLAILIHQPQHVSLY